MLLLLKRYIHHHRIPGYKGYWTEILKRANDATTPLQEQPSRDQARSPIPIPFIELNDNVQPKPKAENTKSIVYLRGRPIELIPKPEPPDNCCMSGCVHCVWDLYEEDMEDYKRQKEELQSKFLEAGEPIPKELQGSTKAKEEVMEDIDPAMKAFLEMEKKLKAKK